MTGVDFGSHYYVSISARVRSRPYISCLMLEAIFSIDDHLVCLRACVRHTSCVVLRTDVTDVATGTCESVDPPECMLCCHCCRSSPLPIGCVADCLRLHHNSRFLTRRPKTAAACAPARRFAFGGRLQAVDVKPHRLYVQANNRILGALKRRARELGISEERLCEIDD